MKTRRGFVFEPRSAVSRVIRGCALLLAAGSLSPGYSQAPPELAPQTRDQNVMKFKLHYAQGVLEAIATENFPLMATNASQLGKLTRQVSWRIRHSPEYARLTADFQRTAGALAKAADSQNIDAATVAYFQMTVSCVTCHQYLKGRDVALNLELKPTLAADPLASLSKKQKQNRNSRNP